MARRFAPALTAEDVRMSKQDQRVMGICFRTMAEANKVGPAYHEPFTESGASWRQRCFDAS